VDEVLLHAGAVFSGATTAVWSRPTNLLLMGAVHDPGLFVCPYPAPDQHHLELVPTPPATSSPDGPTSDI
jgi:hypothetical protein